MGMKHDDLISFILEEAQHCVINKKHTKSMETALAAHTKKGKQNKSGKQKKSSSLTKEECDNCGRPSHTINDVSLKEGEKKWKLHGRRKREKKPEVAMVVVANNKENDLFAFTCTSDFADVAESSNLPKSKYGMCLDSGASNNYSPDRTKFSNSMKLTEILQQWTDGP